MSLMTREFTRLGRVPFDSLRESKGDTELRGHVTDRRRTLSWPLLSLTLFLPFAAKAQEPNFDLRLSSPTSQLGEAVQLEATAHYRASQTLALDLAASSTDTYRIARAKDLGFKDGAQTFLLDVVPLAIGKIPVVLRWTFQGKSIESPAATLEVPEPPLEKDAQLLGIKEPRAARAALWPWLLLALLLIAAWLAYRYFKKKPLGEALQEEPRDDRPPHLRAEAELADLEASELWTERRYKEFYIRLTDILRQYLDGRFGIPAQHLTTTELSRQMRQAELDRKAAAMVKELFDRADLVKFAKITPDADSGAQDIQSARGVVAETAPKEAAAAP